jgi:hypothetical protein
MGYHSTDILQPRMGYHWWSPQGALSATRTQVLYYIHHTPYTTYTTHCTHSALTLHSLCTHSALTLHSLCTHSALTLHSLCTHSALTLSSHCTHTALTLYSLCTHSALTLHSLCTQVQACRRCSPRKACRSTAMDGQRKACRLAPSSETRMPWTVNDQVVSRLCRWVSAGRAIWSWLQ